MDKLAWIFGMMMGALPCRDGATVPCGDDLFVLAVETLEHTKLTRVRRDERLPVFAPGDGLVEIRAVVTLDRV